MKRPRVEKPEIRKLSELEDHLYLLRQQYSGLAHDPAHLCVLAAELRALICFSSGTEGLLWRLTEALGISDVVTVRAVGGIDPDHSLARGIRLFVPTLLRPAPNLPPRFRCEEIEMRLLVKECMGAYTLGRSFTHEQLIKKIAEQIGSAHIDDGIEPGLATMEELLISGRPSYSSILAFLASLTLEVGERVIAVAVERGIYKRRRYSPPVTISVHVSLREVPFGHVPVVSFDLYTSGIRLDTYITPQSFVYVVTKREREPIELRVGHPADWQTGEESLFCLIYEHANSVVRIVGPHRTGDQKERCDLGFLWADPLEWSEPELHGASADYVNYLAFYVHSRVLTPDDAAHVAGFLIRRSDLHLPE